MAFLFLALSRKFIDNEPDEQAVRQQTIDCEEKPNNADENQATETILNPEKFLEASHFGKETSSLNDVAYVSLKTDPKLSASGGY